MDGLLPESHPTNHFRVNSIEWHEAMAQRYDGLEFYGLVYVKDDLTWDFEKERAKLLSKTDAHIRAAQLIREGFHKEPIHVISVSKNVYA